MAEEPRVDGRVVDSCVCDVSMWPLLPSNYRMALRAAYLMIRIIKSRGVQHPEGLEQVTL